jgi:hypothetical protein
MSSEIGNNFQFSRVHNIGKFAILLHVHFLKRAQLAIMQTGGIFEQDGSIKAHTVRELFMQQVPSPVMLSLLHENDSVALLVLPTCNDPWSMSRSPPKSRLMFCCLDCTNVLDSGNNIWKRL